MKEQVYIQDWKKKMTFFNKLAAFVLYPLHLMVADKKHKENWDTYQHSFIKHEHDYTVFNHDGKWLKCKHKGCTFVGKNY